MNVATGKVKCRSGSGEPTIPSWMSRLPGVGANTASTTLNVRDAGGPTGTFAAVTTPVAVSMVTVPSTIEPLTSVPDTSKSIRAALAATGAVRNAATSSDDI